MPSSSRGKQYKERNIAVLFQSITLTQPNYRSNVRRDIKTAFDTRKQLP